ncbi:MAG: hypothetical protein EOO90_03640 [Pedobacter sp.]|nr:MAG: hypothetical protein EOO90_03640 [Pedobacter sp.]
MKSFPLPVRKTLLLMIALVIPIEILAQIRFPITEKAYQKHKEDIDSLLNNSKRLMVPRLFSQKLDSILNKASGFAYKDGKAGRTSATLEEQSLTVNLNLVDRNRFTLQLSATGARNEKMLDIFSEGKYANTLSAGLKVNFFPFTNFGRFDKVKNKQLLNDKLIWMRDFQQKSRQAGIHSQKLSELIILYQSYGKYLHPQNLIDENMISNYEQSMARLRELLGLFAPNLPKKFLQLDAASQTASINALNSNRAEVAKNFGYKIEMDTLDNIQLSTQYNMLYLNWFTFGANINNEKYPFFDSNAEELTRDYHDNYLTMDLAWNFLWKYSTRSLYLFPKISFSRARDFSGEPLRNLHILQGENKLKDSTAHKEYQTVSYYQNKGPRHSALALELPFMIYCPKTKIGLDLAVTHEIIPFRNFGGRIGVYLPIPAGEQTLTIEPLVKFNNLFDSKKSFRDEKIYFGFNVSVSIPNFFSGN